MVDALFLHSFVAEKIFGNQILYKAKLRNEMRKKRVFSRDVVFMPICDNRHWFLTVLYPRSRRIHIYMIPCGPVCHFMERRSVSSVTKKYLTTLATKENVNGIIWAISEIESSHGRNIPTQTNGQDCGVFVCKAAKSTSLMAPLSFCQDDMKHIRLRMSIEILSREAVNLHGSRLRFLYI